MKKTLKNGLLIVSTIIVSFVLFQSAFGQQDYGSINGTVKDQNDAVVSGANIKATNTATGVEKTTTTNSDGFYQFTGVLPGEYSISVNAGNFKAFTTKAQVSVGGARTIDVKLGIAVDINIVDVPAGGGGVAEINTSDQVQSTVVNQRQINELPTLDRNPYALIQLSGNVNADTSGSGRGAGFAINGQRVASTEILLDGTENQATFTAGIAQGVPQDAVGEFRVITSNFSAEFGRASGGVVNVSTKAGGNKFNGDLFEQNRNSGFSSNSFDNNANGLPRAQFNRNQFGGALGGPIKQNKIFFFDALEFTRVRSSDTTLVYVPTAGCVNLMAANAKAIFAANTLSATPTGATATVNGCTFQLTSYTAPTDAGGGTPQNTWSNAARVDWNVSNNTSMYFSYKIENDGFLPGTRFTSPYAGYTTGLTGRSQNIQGSFVHNFSSNFIVDGKVAWRRLQSTPSLGSKNPATPTLYATSATAFLNGRLVAFPGYIPYSPGAGFDTNEDERLLDVKPNATWIKGNHTFRFGGQYVHLQDAVVFGAYLNASENLSSTLGGAVNHLLGDGMTDLFQVAIDPQGKFPGQTITLPVKAPNFLRTNVYNEYALYFNDQWRIGRRVTLNLGIRYEYYGTQKSKEGLDSNFYFGSGNIFNSIRTGSVQTGSSQGGLWKPGKNWAPRLGFAWDITGDGKTSLRGGYGISYERNFGNVTFNVIQNPPFYGVLGVNSVPIDANNYGPLSGSGTATLPAVTLRAVDPNIKNAYAHQYGVSFERQIAANTLVKVDYSGSAGRRLYSIANINRRGSGLAYLGSTDTTRTCPTGGRADRLNCQYGNVNFRGSDGVSNYNGITGSLESNNLFGTGIVITSRYTFSNSKDDLSTTFSEFGNNFNLGYLDPFNPKLDYGPSDFDVRHRFVTSIIYPVKYKFTNHAANYILGGWNVSSIITIQSGTPFSIFDCSNANAVCPRLLGGQSITFNGFSKLISANNYNFIDLSKVTPISPTDPRGFNDEGPYPSNMTTRNSFRAPGNWNVDASLFKNFSVRERYGLQIRVDAFNLFNHATSFVNGGSSDVTNGVVNAFKDGKRNIQLSAKFSF